MGNSLDIFGNEISVIILGSRRGRNVGPRPHRPLLPQRLDRAPGEVIIPLCCTDLTVGCISQVAGDLSRVLLLLPLLTVPPRSRTPCSGPGTPCPSSWLARWSPQFSSGWWRQLSTTSTGVSGSPGPSNVSRIKIAVLFRYIFKDNIEQYCLNRRFPHRVLSPLFIAQFPEYPSASPSHGQWARESIIG